MIGLIGPHVQNTPTGKYPGEFWEVAAKLPHETFVKLVMAVERALEVPAHLNVWYRWAAPNQNVDFGNLPAYVKQTWITAAGTLIERPDIARRVSIVQDPMNEYLDEGHDGPTVQRWVDYFAALCAEWARLRDQHAHLRHIDIAGIGMPPGNGSMKHIGFAQVAERYRDFVVLDYHAYWPTANKVKMPDEGRHPDGREINEWKYFSGRWDVLMDREWAKHGYKVRWCFGEAGPIRDASPWYGSMQPHDGWRHPGTCNGDIDAYWSGIETWARRVVQTPAYREGRVVGSATLFTTDPPRGKDSPDWDDFQTDIGNWRVIAQRYADLHRTLPQPGATPPPPPPPKPPEVQPPPATDGKPRLDYRRVMHVAPQDIDEAGWLEICRQAYVNKQSVGFSHDDAGIGALSDKTAVLHGISPAEQDIYRDWYAVHYPGTRLEFRELASGVVSGETYVPQPVIIDVVDELPRHAHKFYQLRPVENITHLVVHHTVGDSGPHNIAAYHVRTRDWPGIGYHYVIERNGRIYQTNRHETVSWHAGAANDYSVGLALVGNFMQAIPTTAQLDAARELVAWLRAGLPNARAVVGHRDVVATECPGDTYTQWLDDIR